jgi:hypothetical protein
VYVLGDVQPSAVLQSTAGESAPRSTHWKVTPVSTLAANVNVALVSTVTRSGVESIDAWNSPSSTAHVYSSGVGSMFPEKSSARTPNVWVVPSARLLIVFGLVQTCQSLSSVLSRRHW